MSWIKDNKFIVALGGGTLLAAAVLVWVGLRGGSHYEEAKANFEESAAEASKFEKLALYPRQENRDGKRKALEEYRKSVESLQAAFESYRPSEIKDISPQDFTTRLKSVDDEVRKAFEESEVKVPDAFFCGFENYKTSLARGDSTGILNYQLEGIRNLMLTLAKSGITEFKNLHRPLLAEEKGEKYEPKADEVARPLPLEIAFNGPEKAVRAFVSSVVKPDSRYIVIRSLRILNEKKDPPRSADARFEKSATATPAAAESFGGGFVLPGEEPAAAEAEAAPAASTAPETDTSRILAPVLGNEEIRVLLRLDIMQFLPAKKLP